MEGKKYRSNFDRVEKRIKEVEKKDKIRNWTNPISGDKIMEVMDVKPGPIIGKVKEEIKEAIFDGKIPNEYDAALEYLMKIKDRYEKKGE